MHVLNSKRLVVR